MEKAPPLPLPALHRPKLLLAGSDVTMLDSIKHWLSSRFEVETVANGADALLAIEVQYPNLVLTDVTMPEMNGLELLRSLRSNPSTQNIPAILILAQPGEEAQIAELEVRADDYLIKPFSLRELLARIEATLKLAQLRQETAQTLQRSEERYRAFVQQSSEAIWCFEVEPPVAIDCSEDEQIQQFYQSAYLAECNQVMVQMYGVTSLQSLIGARLPDLVLPSDPRNQEYLRAFIHSGYRLVDAESYEIDQHGNPKIFLNNLIGIVEDGKLMRAWGTQRDITDFKQAEAALQQSEERYRYLAEMIPQLVWTADADGVLIDINQRWSDYTGLSLAQAKIEGWEAIIHPDDVPALSQNWAAAQQARGQYRAEGRMRRADGAYRWHLHQAIPLKNEQGEIIKWFGTATDIEAQKQLESQRQYLLEREQAAREQAEAANRIKDEFLAVLSHELRSPLNPILGWSKLLKSGKLDQVKTEQALTTIERNARLQAELIEDLLDVSRILRGKLNFNINPVNLIPIIRAAIETVRLAAEAKAINLRFMIRDDGLEVDDNPKSKVQSPKFQMSGDTTRLQQVVWNLLTNAIKFTPTGGQVEVRLEQIGDEEELGYGVSGMGDEISPPLQPLSSNPLPNSPISYAQITITDTGKGIHPEFLPHVFEYFRQEDGSTTRKFGGLGLGLAIARQIVEMHGGTISVESQGEGMGATFTVRLPLRRNEDDEEVEGWEEHSATPSPPHPLAGLHILLVEDELDTREFQAFVLKQNGANVIAVASGWEGLQVLDQFIPDVIISDVGMAEMDGYMLMQHIRSRHPEQGGTIPAISLTAYAAEVDQQKAFQAGFQAYLTKPVDPATLVKTVITVISAPQTGSK
ncbi:MAG: response regulator [Oscillatoriales cyanobacterium C42_A2020_001]|nr:response regulator [Leptolyngbyaceae cyanobacterium C42_A2020_001]